VQRILMLMMIAAGSLLGLVTAQQADQFSDVTTLHTLSGHTDKVWIADFSPDSRILASGSLDKTARLWDVSNGSLIRVLQDPTDSVNSVAFSPTSNTLVSVSNKSARLWDVSNGNTIRTVLTGHSSGIIALAIGGDGRTFATGSHDNTIRLWDLPSGYPSHVLTGHSGFVQSVAFSPDSSLIASGSGDNTVRLWNASSGELISTFTGHSNWIRSVAFSPDGRVIASASEDHTVRLWDISSKKIVHRLSDHSSGVLSVAFSPDGRTLASASSDKTIRLWDVSSGNLIHTLTGHSDGVFAVVFSPDGRTLASTSFDRTVKLWGTANREPVFGVSQAWLEKFGQKPDTTRLTVHYKRLKSDYDGWNLWVWPDSPKGSDGSSYKLTGTDGFGQVAVIDVPGRHTKLGVITRLGDWQKKDVDTLVDVSDGKAEVWIFEGRMGFEVSRANADAFLASGQSWSSKGSLFFHSNNERANLFINGENKGVTGASRALELPAGTYTVTLSATNFQSQTKTITIKAGETTKTDFNLEWQDSTLNLRSNTEGANISINGEGKGVTGATRDFKLQPGTYSVEVNAPGFKTQTQTVLITGGRNANLVFNLEPEAVAAPEPKPTEAASTTTPTSSDITASSTGSTALTSNAISTLPRTNIRALVIGIGSYDEDRIPKLESAESDAKKFAAALTDPKIGNVSSENVEPLIGSKATKTRIEARVKALASQTKTGETLIVYFSGHGAPSAQGEPWLVPWDADPNDLASSVVSLRDLQATGVGGGNLVLILDSCFSGDAKGKSFTAPGAKPFGIVVKAPAVSGNVSVLSASGSDESSFENPSVGGGYFTSFLIEGMKDGLADSNGDGVVSLEEAFNYAKPKVAATARSRNSAKQTPQLKGAGDFTLAVNSKAVSDARAGKLSMLLGVGKISPEQFEKLLEQVNAGQEAPTLKSYLDGSISEATFLAALKNGGLPGVPKR
jgi:Bacterial pullanase-associated domain/Caspase domain/WD domain, G-beta repeat/PEGA domain